MNLRFLLVACLAGALLPASSARSETRSPSAIRKGKDIVIYRDDNSTAPSLDRAAAGWGIDRCLPARARAPVAGRENVSHTDPNSYLVLVRSRDDGQPGVRRRS